MLVLDCILNIAPVSSASYQQRPTFWKITGKNVSFHCIRPAHAGSQFHAWMLSEKMNQMIQPITTKGRILSESNWKKNLLTENPLLPASVPIFSLKFPANVCEMIYSGDRVMFESSMSSYIEKGKTKQKKNEGIAFWMQQLSRVRFATLRFCFHHHTYLCKKP